jgi:hypothetical protein
LLADVGDLSPEEDRSDISALDAKDITAGPIQGCSEHKEGAE